MAASASVIALSLKAALRVGGLFCIVVYRGRCAIIEQRLAEATPFRGCRAKADVWNQTFTTFIKISIPLLLK
ncbi:hypothetical protein [Peribacillus muralis]|uniref:hypothetical protein n=1 Tax=Peribacillus muralis TaxID=264697 RepID=UPI00367012FD